MKKGKLFKEGKTWKIASAELKTSPIAVLGDFGLSDSMDGEEVEFDHSGGPVNLIRHAGKEYRKKAWGESSNPVRDQRGGYQQRDQRYSHGGAQQQKPKRDPAFAPYNFIPLNHKVVSSNTTEIDHAVFRGLSGTIELELTALTPLFIKGNNYQFHTLQGKPFIPGSSMRGMIRNLLTIMAYGKMDQVESRTLYKRSTLLEDGKQVFAGFMTIRNGKYSIERCQVKQVKGHEFSRRNHHYAFSDNHCIFSTGAFGGRGSIVWRFDRLPAAETLAVDDTKVIDGYLSDDTRAENAVDLTMSLKKRKIFGKIAPIGNVDLPQWGIPVFFRINQAGDVSSIGHAKYHRIPYAHSITDLIQQEAKEEADFPTAIFGDTNTASKVYFEDLFLEGQVEYALNQAQYLKILSSPKPTTYQHYLEQPSGVDTTQTNLLRWSDPQAKIRGYKNYWHRQTSPRAAQTHSWVESNPPTRSHMPHPVNPLKKGVVFKGQLRFSNLNEQELGALLLALDLPAGCAHKLGMGKPLGLGSVEIRPSLTLQNRKERYSTLFDAEGQNWFAAERSEANLELYKDAFAQHIGQQTYQQSINTADTYWQQDKRMQDLHQMLCFKHELIGASVHWTERTRYQELAEFKKRPVLPTPDEVSKPNSY